MTSTAMTSTGMTSTGMTSTAVTPTTGSALDPSRPPLDDASAQQRDALAARLFDGLLAGAEVLTVELGRRLGLYAAVHQQGATTAAGLAAGTGIAERYAREWLEQQAAAGVLDVAGPGRFTLPAAHVPVLLVADDPAHVLAAGPLLTGLALALPAVAQAYRTGEGVPYPAFGPELRHGLAAFNRPGFVHDLPDWLATLPDVVRRLAGGGRVLDLGCGTGWSSIGLARALPAVHVHGVDLDEASVAEAREHAALAGLGDRVVFSAGAAQDVTDDAAYDLVCVFEALHDMGDPVAALRSARAALAPGGALLVADELVADEFTAPAGEAERLQYAFSVLHCLPATMAESTAVASGTVLRTSTVREWAREAGWSAVDVLPVEHEFWRFYRFTP